MAAGKRSSTEVVIKFDDGPGGTLRRLTGFVLEMGGCKITSKMQASTAYAALIETMHPTGVSIIAKMKLRGFMDTSPLAADPSESGPHLVLKTPDTDPNGGTRTLRIEFGDSIIWQIGRAHV